MGAAVASGSCPRATSIVMPARVDPRLLGRRVVDGAPARGIEPRLGDALGREAARGDDEGTVSGVAVNDAGHGLGEGTACRARAMSGPPVGASPARPRRRGA